MFLSGFNPIALRKAKIVYTFGLLSVIGMRELVSLKRRIHVRYPLKTEEIAVQRFFTFARKC